jgi:hypothetical protein
MNRTLGLLVVVLSSAAMAIAGQPTQLSRGCERQLCDELRSCSNGNLVGLKQKSSGRNKAEASQGQSQQATCREQAVGSYQECSNNNGCLKVKPQESQSAGVNTTTSTSTKTVKQPSAK